MDCWMCEKKDIKRSARVDGQDVCRNCFMASREFYLIMCRKCKTIRFAQKTEANLTSICQKMVQYNSDSTNDSANELKVNMSVSWAKSCDMKMFELLKCGDCNECKNCTDCDCKEEFDETGIG